MFYYNSSLKQTLQVCNCSTLKLANGGIHGDAWYTWCISHPLKLRVNNDKLTMTSLLKLECSNLLTVARVRIKLGTHMHYIFLFYFV